MEGVAFGVAVVFSVLLLIILMQKADIKDEKAKTEREVKAREETQKALERETNEWKKLAKVVNEKLNGQIGAKIQSLESERKALEGQRTQIVLAAESEAQRIRKQAEEKQALVEQMLVVARERLEALKGEEGVTIPWVAQQFLSFFETAANEVARTLEMKRNPALKAADALREEGRLLREAERKMREWKLRCEYYEMLFPFLAEVADDGDSLVKQEQLGKVLQKLLLKKVKLTNQNLRKQVS